MYGLVVDFQGNFAKRGVVRVECAFIGRFHGRLHNGGKLFGRELEFVLRERSCNVERRMRGLSVEFLFNSSKVAFAQA